MERAGTLEAARAQRRHVLFCALAGAISILFAVPAGLAGLVAVATLPNWLPLLHYVSRRGPAWTGR